MIRKSALAALALLFPSISHAEIPVVDAQAVGELVGVNASMLQEIANQLEMLANLAQQITALTNLVSLATVASEALGDTVSPEVGALLNSATDLYGKTSRAYGSVMAVPARVNYEMALFQPPPDGWTSMSPMAMISRAQQIRRLAAGTGQATVATQAEMMERRMEIARLSEEANAMAIRSRSALSATQALAEQARVSGMVLGNIEKNTGDIATIAAMQLSQQTAEQQAVQATMERQIVAMRQRAMEAPGEMQISPVQWGR